MIKHTCDEITAAYRAVTDAHSDMMRKQAAVDATRRATPEYRAAVADFRAAYTMWGVLKAHYVTMARHNLRSAA
jgi:hypothetical protein